MRCVGVTRCDPRPLGGVRACAPVRFRPRALIRAPQLSGLLPTARSCAAPEQSPPAGQTMVLLHSNSHKTPQNGAAPDIDRTR